jgi:hypothetical protein
MTIEVLSYLIDQGKRNELTIQLGQALSGRLSIEVLIALCMLCALTFSWLIDIKAKFNGKWAVGFDLFP